MIIIGPYLYYAVKVNTWGLANKPAGFRFPHISDFWRIPVATAVWMTVRKSWLYLMTDFFKPYAKK